ncbi:MAG: M23 family metallopeptidase [Proteobacteria bacterium]|nr:M23 family metallopeptidase [Pseudomonadota bacterium]MBU1688055.1 M23 family metallopeptidase [Pseudomonadota bacterium]
MDRKLHIIVTGEQGLARTFVLSKPIVLRVLIFLVLILSITTTATFQFSFTNVDLQQKVSTLQSNLNELSAENKTLNSQVLNLEEKNKTQLTGVYGELSQRSQTIDTILGTLDIVSPEKKSRSGGKGGPAPPMNTDNSGGPFIGISGDSCEDLIMKVDRDMDLLRFLPLGYPVKANRISSSYGRRTDPMNGILAFHDGVDLSGEPGLQVKATADGRVLERGNNPTYGWYVKVDHGNRFTTLYAHNQKLLVKKGDTVTRGQIIATMGNSGRSTGPHLHYEIRYKKKPVNPLKFLNIYKLISTGDA